jgi:cell division septum initiation protein DivIVA
VDIIYQLKKNEQQLREEVDSLQEALQDKQIRISTAGSIAEAALSINNVFSSAQSAADLYLQQIRQMKQSTQSQCEKMLEEARQKSADMLARSEQQCALLNAQYRREKEKLYKLHQQVQLLEKTVREATAEE